MPIPSLAPLVNSQLTWTDNPTATWTILNPVAVGDLIVVEAWGAAAVTDSGGNTYAVKASGGDLAVWVAPVTTALTSGVSTITVTGSRGWGAFRVRDFDAIQLVGKTAYASGTTTLANTPPGGTNALTAVVIANPPESWNVNNIATRSLGALYEDVVPLPAGTLGGHVTNRNGEGHLAAPTEGWTFYQGQSNTTASYSGGTWTYNLTVTSSGWPSPSGGPPAKTEDWQVLTYQLLGVGTLTAPWPPEPSEAQWPAVLVTKWGEYYRASCEAGNLWFRRAPHVAVPFDLEQQVTTGGADSRPSLARDHGERAFILFSRGGNVYEVLSDSDGVHWDDPELAFTGGLFNDQTTNPHTGARLTAALVGTTIQAAYIAPDGTVSTFNFKQVGGAALVLDAADGFSIAYSPGAEEIVTAGFHVDGESEISDWISVDDGRHFARVT